MVTGDFTLIETEDPDGSLRLALVGELDLAGVDALARRLSDLGRAQQRVRLDLSQLGFLDCTGLRTIMTGVVDAQRDGWELTVERQVTNPVRRVIVLAGAQAHIWPA